MSGSSSDVILAPKKLKYDVRIPYGYLHPYHTVPKLCFTNRSYDLLSQLRCIDSNVISSAGPMNVRTSTTNQPVTAYEQLLFAVSGRYYSSLPKVHYDADTFECLHHCMSNLHAAPYTIDPAHAVLRRACLYISKTDLDPLVVKLAWLLLKSEAVFAYDLSTVMTQAECMRSIDDELFSSSSSSYDIHPAAEGAYRMVYQIEPVPELIKNDYGLSLYIVRMACGSGIILTTDVDMPSFPSAVSNTRSSNLGGQIIEGDTTCCLRESVRTNAAMREMHAEVMKTLTAVQEQVKSIGRGT